MTEYPRPRLNWELAIRRFQSIAVLSRFASVGLATTAVYPLAFLLGIRLGLQASLAAFLAYAFTSALSYVGHRQFSFRSRRHHGAALRSFIPLTAVGISIAVALPWLSERLDLPYWTAAIATCVAIPVVNAVLLSGLVFPPDLAMETLPDGNPAKIRAGLAEREWRQSAGEVALLALACLPSLMLSLSLVSPAFIRGDGEVWLHAISDRSASLSGYMAFVATPWQWPIFFLPTQSVPEGMLLANGDSLPLVAVLGRLLHDVTGLRLNLLGGTYVAFQFLNSVGAILLARRFGARDVISLAAVGLIFGALPMALIRYLHTSLTAHWLLLFALLAYLIGTDRQRALSAYALLTLLAVMAAMTHIYLWVMVAAIALARLLQDAVGKRTRTVALGALVITSASIATVAALGYLSLAGSAENSGYMTYSLNLMSPFYSNVSGFLPQAWAAVASAKAQGNAWLFFHQQWPDATAQQFTEGMAYVGAGGLIIILAGLCRIHPRSFFERIGRHPWLALAAVGALAFAVSPMITFGSWILTRATLPPELAALAGAFRASGRFAWLPLYLGLIALLAAIIRSYQVRVQQAILVGAALMQLLDTQPLRSAIAFDSAHGVRLFNPMAWQPMLENARQIMILPSFECSDERNNTLKTGLHVLAARLGPIPINSASQSRSTKDCHAERRLLAQPLPPDELYMFFDSDLPDEAIAAFIANAGEACSRFSFGTYCVRSRAPRYDLCVDAFTRSDPKFCPARRSSGTENRVESSP